jgi:hypothetical protein
MGGFTDAYPTVLFTDKACWVQRASDAEIHFWQQRSASVSHRIYFAEDPGVGADCVIEQGGWWYEVISEASPDASVGLGLLWRVMVSQLEEI